MRTVETFRDTKQHAQLFHRVKVLFRNKVFISLPLGKVHVLFFVAARHKRRQNDFSVRSAADHRIQNHVHAVFLMPVILDSQPHVVHERRDFQNFKILPRKLMQHAQLLEQLYGKMHHVLHVRGVAAVIQHQRFQRIIQYVGNRLFHRHRHGLIEHDALAQTVSADREVFHAHIIHKRFDDSHRGGHNVRTGRRKPADFFAFIDIQRLYFIVNHVEIVRRQAVVMYRVQRVFLNEFADFEQVSERTSHADHLHFFGIHFGKPVDFFQLFREKFHGVRRRFFGRAVVREKVGQRNRAERQRCRTDHVSAVVINHFRAAAADFKDKPLGNIHRVDYAAVYQNRLFLFGKHADFNAAGCLNFIEKRTLVFRPAHRRRSHRDDAAHPRRVAKPLEHFQRADGFRHALRLQKAVSVHILPQPNAFFQLVGYHKMPFREQIHDNQSCRIRSEIDNAYSFHFVF